MKYRGLFLLLLVHQAIVGSASGDDPKNKQKICVKQVAQSTKTRNRAFSFVMEQKPNALDNIKQLVEKEGPDVATALLENVAQTKGEHSKTYFDILIKNDADVSGRRKKGPLVGSQKLTPLDLAIMKGNIDIAKCLLSEGASTQFSYLLGYDKKITVLVAVQSIINKFDRSHWRHEKGITCSKKEIQKIKELLEQQEVLLKEKEKAKKAELKRINKERRRLKPSKSQELLTYFKKK